MRTHTHTHTPALISPHFNLGPVTTMRLPTSDSKLFLFNEKKTSCLLVWKERLADKTKGGGREGGGGDSECAAMCVCIRAWICMCVCVHVCKHACVCADRAGTGSCVCIIHHLAHLVLLHIYVRMCVFSVCICMCVYLFQTTGCVRVLQAGVCVWVCVCGGAVQCLYSLLNMFS